LDSDLFTHSALAVCVPCNLFKTHLKAQSSLPSAVFVRATCSAGSCVSNVGAPRIPHSPASWLSRVVKSSSSFCSLCNVVHRAMVSTSDNHPIPNNFEMIVGLVSGFNGCGSRASSGTTTAALDQVTLTRTSYLTFIDLITTRHPQWPKQMSPRHLSPLCDLERR